MILVQSGVVAGIDGFLIDVEVDVRPGLPGFEIVGLPSATVRESRERVRSALKNSGFRFPSQKVVVNLAPAHYPKDGALLDLPIALGILAKGGMIPLKALKNSLFVGELSLSGKIKRISGVLPLATLARKLQFKFILPQENQEEVGLLQEDFLVTASSLGELVAYLAGRIPAPPRKTKPFRPQDRPDLPVIKGQEQAKRALSIAALGRHHLMLIGPPGVGKTLLARSARALLPPLSKEETLEVNKIYEAAGLTKANSLILERPFRSPHHSVSQSALIGGQKGRPGEITLAHLGILLLDEFAEFNISSLQGLREPLDHKEVRISRARQVLTYPADFWLIATANPCPCGYYGSSTRLCTCTARDLTRYRRKLSGPLTDRFALFCFLSPLSQAELEQIPAPWPPPVLPDPGRQNPGPALTPEARDFLLLAQKSLFLSVRGFESTLAVAASIARLENAPEVKKEHVAEAIQYRVESQQDLLC